MYLDIYAIIVIIRNIDNTKYDFQNLVLKYMQNIPFE